MLYDQVLILLAPLFSNLSSGSPSFVNISIDTPRVYVYALFKGGYTKCSIFYLRDAASIVLSVHVGLQFVVYPIQDLEPHASNGQD